MAQNHEQGPPEALIISTELYEAMIDHVRSVAPMEGCGLIAMVGNQAVKLFPGTNTEQSTTRYNMDPAEVIAAFDEMDRQGWQFGAIFHSHPRSEAYPSPTDLRHAYYPEALMVIISLAVDPPVVRAFQVDEDIREVPLTVLPPDAKVRDG